jgi:hypothetical protein
VLGKELEKEIRKKEAGGSRIKGREEGRRW